MRSRAGGGVRLALCLVVPRCDDRGGEADSGHRSPSVELRTGRDSPALPFTCFLQATYRQHWVDQATWLQRGCLAVQAAAPLWAGSFRAVVVIRRAVLALLASSLTSPWFLTPLFRLGRSPLPINRYTWRHHWVHPNASNTVSPLSEER